MKKIIILIMLFVAFGVGCGKSNGGQPDTKGTTVPIEGKSGEETKVGEVTTGETESIEISKNERIYEPQFIADGQPINYIQNSVGSTTVVYDVPNYQIVEEGLTILYIRSGKLCIAVTRGREDGATGMALEDVFPTVEKSFGYAMSSNLEGGLNYHGLDMSETEEVAINGVDCLHFTGEIDGRSYLNPDEKKRGYYARGYAFVMDDTPYTIIGVVLDDGTEGQEYIDRFTEEVNHNLDELMKTLRDHFYN